MRRGSKAVFEKTAQENGIIVSEHLDYVYHNYFELYEDPLLENTVSLINVCVAKEYRGQGVASTIMKAFIDCHRKEKMELCVLKNNAGAIKLYEKCGFKVTGGRKGFSVEETKPDVLEMLREEC